VEEKKNNLIQSFCHITLCYILEKNFRLEFPILFTDLYYNTLSSW
jgi:hypothetical protein